MIRTAPVMILATRRICLLAGKLVVLGARPACRVPNIPAACRSTAPDYRCSVAAAAGGAVMHAQDCEEALAREPVADLERALSMAEGPSTRQRTPCGCAQEPSPQLGSSPEPRSERVQAVFMGAAAAPLDSGGVVDHRLRVENARGLKENDQGMVGVGQAEDLVVPGRVHGHPRAPVGRGTVHGDRRGAHLSRAPWEGGRNVRTTPERLAWSGSCLPPPTGGGRQGRGVQKGGRPGQAAGPGDEDGGKDVLRGPGR